MHDRVLSARFKQEYDRSGLPSGKYLYDALAMGELNEAGVFTSQDFANEDEKALRQPGSGKQSRPRRNKS